MPTSLILQKRITASQGRVKMGAIALMPKLDTHAAARMITLGTTAIVSIISITFIFVIHFSKLLRMTNSYVFKVS